MDWAESQELLDIYLAEVDDRTSRLGPGAAALAAGSLHGFDIEGLVRDAHTLKGSSHMLGKNDLGAAAAALERGWKAVDQLGVERCRPIGEALELVTRLLLQTARDSSKRDHLTGAASRLSSAIEALENSVRQPALVPDGGSGHSPSETERMLEPQRPTIRLITTPAEPVVVEPLPVGVERGDSAPEEAPAAMSLEEDNLTERAAPSNLGGLLGTLREELSGSVTRVDTRDLYRLINRAVELGLDADSLADLTHVSFEGADPQKLLSAWRSQLVKMSEDVGELQQWAVGLANVPLREATETYPQFVRFLSRRLGRDVRFTTTGTGVQVDRQIVDVLREPLRHLIVNAIDHGIEPPEERARLGKSPMGTVRLDTQERDDRLVISVADDGRGVDWEAVARAAAGRGLGRQRSELMAHLFRPGFTTVTEPNDFSGTGEGLTLVADSVDRVGGSVTVESRPGLGTIVRLDVPLSLVLQNIVIVASGDQFFGVNEPAVRGTVSLETSSVRFTDHGRDLVHEGEGIPIVSFARSMGLSEEAPENEALVLTTRYGLVAVSVSEIVDRRRVAVKSLGPILDGADHLTGAAFVGGGEVLVVVDHNHLGAQARRPEELQGVRPRVLVVDDSAGVRQLIAATLRGRGFDVTVASSAKDAAREIARVHFDVLIVDYSMPNSNGVELVRALRDHGVIQPIIMVSGVADESDKAAAWEAGVDAYLDKYDLRRGSLTTTLRRLLEVGNGREPR